MVKPVTPSLLSLVPPCRRNNLLEEFWLGEYRNVFRVLRALSAVIASQVISRQGEAFLKSSFSNSLTSSIGRLSAGAPTS